MSAVWVSLIWSVTLRQSLHLVVDLGLLWLGYKSNQNFVLHVPNLRETGKRSFKWIILFIWVEDLFILKDFCLYFYCPFSIFFQRGLTTHLQKLFNQYSQTPCGIEYFTKGKKTVQLCPDIPLTSNDSLTWFGESI